MIQARSLRTDEAHVYVAIRREMLRDTPWAFTASPETDRGSDVAIVEASLRREGFAIGGAFDGERLLSVAVLRREDRPKRAHLAWIESVHTRPEARRQGASRHVIAHLIELARSWGVAALALSVNERSPGARALYESLGFVAWGTEPDAMRVDGVASAETYMRLAL